MSSMHLPWLWRCAKTWRSCSAVRFSLVPFILLVSRIAATKESSAPLPEALTSAIELVEATSGETYGPAIDEACHRIKAAADAPRPASAVLVGSVKCLGREGRYDLAAEACKRGTELYPMSVRAPSSKGGAAPSASDEATYFSGCRDFFETSVSRAVSKPIHFEVADAAHYHVSIESRGAFTLRPNPGSPTYLYRGAYDLVLRGEDGTESARQHLDLNDEFTRLDITVVDRSLPQVRPSGQVRVYATSRMTSNGAWTSRKSSYVLGGAAAAALGVGVALHFQVPSTVDKMTNEPDAARYNQLRSRAIRLQTAAIALEVTGGVLAASAALVYLHLWPFSDAGAKRVGDTHKLQLTLMPSGAWLSGVF